MKSFLRALALVALASAGCGFGNPPATGQAGTGGPAGSSGVAGNGVAGTGGTGTDAGAGGTGGSGTDGGADADPNMPMLLSQTGLYSNVKNMTLGAGVFPFQPSYFLWSDSAAKRRWVQMPSGGKIDTDNIGSMEFWVYPVGFKLWKEFSRDGKLIETRLLMKKGQGLNDWFMMAYKWNTDGSDAVAVPMGEVNSMGTQHDIPTKEHCATCHGSAAMFDTVLGFSALQLAHPLATTDPAELNLDKIVTMGWLTKAPAVPPALPGDATEKAALGYLHANCGTCHNERGKAYLTSTDLDLWTHFDQVATVQTTRAYLSSVCDQWPKGPADGGAHDKFNPITTCAAGHATGALNEGAISKVAKRIVPKMPAMSSLHELMALRGDANSMSQMPPIATKIVDAMGVMQLDAWINKLP